MAFILAVMVVAALLLRVRVRIEIDGLSRRRLFVGVGRTGLEYGHQKEGTALILAGRNIKRFSGKPAAPTGKAGEREKAPSRPRRKRQRSWIDMVRLVRPVSAAVWTYFIALLKSVIVEEAAGRIDAGFDDPSLTGMTYGYYQAALVAAPGVVGRVMYVPDWQGASFDGSARLTLAIPMHRLVWLTARLVPKLPLRKLIRVAIGKKRGV